jgi:hypothetical protein
VSRIADLILAGGQARAEGARNSGAIWGNTVQNLGQIGAQTFQAIDANQQADRAKQAAQIEDEQLRMAFSSPEGPNPQDLISIAGPDRGMKLAQGWQAFTDLKSKRVTDARETAGRLALAMKQLSPGMRSQMWPSVRQAAIDGGLAQAEQLPGEFDDTFADSVIAWATNKAPEAPKPVGTREIRTRNADGSESVQIVEDKPGFSATSAVEPPKPVAPPKPGSEEDFIARFAKDLGKKVDDLTSAQVASARRQYARQTRFETPSAASTTTERIVKDGQIKDVPKAETNTYFAQGWKPFDQVAARSSQPANAEEALDTAAEVRRIATELRNHSGLGSAFGVLDNWTPTLRQGTADAEELTKSLQGLLTLENMGKMKGVLSDSDMRVLRQASTTLNGRLGDNAARKELDRVIGVMGTMIASTVLANESAGRYTLDDGTVWDKRADGSLALVK